MILLVTAAKRSAEFASALQSETGTPVVVAQDLTQAITKLRTPSCFVAVFDENLHEAEPHEFDIAFKHLGMAFPVHVNLATSGTERLLREVRAALRRTKLEEAAAREAAACTVHRRLSPTITALSLRCDQLMKVEGLPAEAIECLFLIGELAQGLRVCLEGL